MAKVKNYNLNVTEVRDSNFKNAFPGIFNFAVGILGFRFQGRFLIFVKSSLAKKTILRNIDIGRTDKMTV